MKYCHSPDKQRVAKRVKVKVHVLSGSFEPVWAPELGFAEVHLLQNMAMMTATVLAQKYKLNKKI
jgi:hypothetical protein